jgi:mannose-6-phosphate isomerase
MMFTIGLLQNEIQTYDWGSRHAIAELLGQPAPADTPQAELWMGAHPKAPSKVRIGDDWEELGNLVAANPEIILGPHAAQKFDGCFPFLFKVLAVGNPLSIQAHPDRKQARAGFTRESRQGIALDAPQRNYQDSNHKPECILALTPFWALKGFRSIPEMLALMENLCPGTLQEEIREFSCQPDSAGLKRFFSQLMFLDRSKKMAAIDEANTRLGRDDVPDGVRNWIGDLSTYYPRDIGVLFPALLNLVRLLPGQALFVSTGELHAYLDGTAIELMANSDNVLRGGMTPKHVDVLELLEALTFEAGAAAILEPVLVASTEKTYAVPADEFLLSVIDVRPDSPYHGPHRRNVEVLLCTAGHARLKAAEENMEIVKGNSVIIAACTAAYTISGDATLYKASVPLDK